MSIPGHEDLDPARDKTELEIVNSLQKKLEEFKKAPGYQTTLDILTGRPADYFSLECQKAGGDRDYREYSDDSEGDTARIQDIITDIIDEMPDSENGALIAFLAEETALFKLLSIAEKQFTPERMSPASTSSSVSLSPTSARRSPPTNEEVGRKRFGRRNILDLYTETSLPKPQTRPYMRPKYIPSPLSPPRAVSTTTIPTT